MTDEEFLLLHGPRLAFEAAMREAAKPRPIIVTERMVEPRQERPRCAPVTLH
jgi:hypothetical protein